MSDSSQKEFPQGDDRQQILADLATWIHQNSPSGQEFYFDEGPVAGPVPQETVEKKATAAEAPREESPFDRQCAAFVAETLTQIDRHRSANLVEVPNPGAPYLEAAGSDPESALATLEAEVLPCTACPLHENRTNTVFGSGSSNADIVFVGEAPGQDEDLQGLPFVGKSGQLLTKILEAIGLDRDEVYICNILKCRPPNNRDPQEPEVRACENHLKKQLGIVRPRVICCLGRVAAQTLLGTTASLTKLRQSVHFYEGIPVMATFHPAALLRHPAWKRDTWDDVRKLNALNEALQNL